METFKRFMTHRGIWLGLGIWSLAGLVALGDHFELNKSEWASWVQAVGSIAAIVAALILAYSARRQSDIERGDLALLAASDMQIPQQKFIVHLEEALSFLGTQDPRTINYNQCAAILSRCGTFSMPELMPLIPVPGRAAAHMARCSRMNETCIESLRRAMATGPIANPQDAADYNAKIVRNLRDCLAGMNAAKTACHAHVNVHAANDLT